MKKIISKVLVTAMLAGTIFTSAAVAGDRDDWSINYVKGCSSSTCKSSDILYVSYYSDGFRAKTLTMSGSADRRIKITTSSEYSMSTRYITTTNVLSSSWKVTGGSKIGNVPFYVYGLGTDYCKSTGYIYINSSAVYNS